MKKHTSIKEIKNNYSKIFRAGYCDLQYIFKYQEPQYYNKSLYGWNCDIYINYSRDIAITTGYRNMAGQKIPDELIKKYTEKAKNILQDTFKKSYDDIKNALDENREMFLTELNNL